MRHRDRRAATPFERLYSVVVLLKGLDGTVELLAGLLLLIAPRATGTALVALATEFAEGGSPVQDATAHALDAAGIDAALGSVGIAAFLLVHGVVKLVTVYALIRRLVRWYPWAIAALGVLLVAQVIDLAVAPSAAGWALAVLDVVVIVLVALEYRRLRAGGDRPPRDPEPRGARQPAAARARGRGR